VRWTATLGIGQDKTKNLLVLLGYVLSLPLDVVQSVIGSDADWHTLWLHILNVRE